MDDAERGQVSRSAAEIYDKFFLPALFEQWTPHVADAASIGAGDHVLDVACGTGVLACEAARRVGAGGAVSGLDRNEGMLAMARRKNPAIDWRRHGDVRRGCGADIGVGLAVAAARWLPIQRARFR